MVKEIQLRINLVEELKEDILLQKASKQLGVDKNEISDELEMIFGSDKRQDTKIKNHAYDKTGNSKTISNYFNLSSGRIRIMCTDWSSKFTNEKNWKDNLSVSIYSKKFSEWLNNKAYK